MLVPLTPEYLPDEHRGYVNAIEAALENDRVLNIALSGNYGVGKSSILNELVKRKKERIVELSLSTLAPVKASDIDDSVPKQATTPTNQIQQEIVKQLLYRKVPGKTPGSRFERIERFSWTRELAFSILAGLIIATVFLLTHWSNQVAIVFKPLIDLGLWVHLIVLLLATATVLVFRILFHGRIHVKQFTAGSATVTLDDKSVSYFDQYLDEIVYFFEVSNKQDIVIFEDIDRFNNSHIFETLRSLNTLLNSAPQIRRNIRFIYAIKDSIFDRIGLEKQGRPLDQDMIEADDPAQAEVIRANRTKFFDLVIPVVPFITHRSARNLAAQLLGTVPHDVKPELLDLAAQYVPDMRLLKNICNEFIVFRDRIFSGDGEQLDLNETDLFAMMLYKSTHLSDFEAIRIGKSKLNTLYALGRELVATNIKRIESERRELQQELGRVNGATSRSQALGRKLIAHVNRTVQAARFKEHDVTYTFSNALQSPEDLQGVRFWSEFVSANSSEATLIWKTNDGYNHSLTFTRESLAEALGDPLNAAAWDESAKENLKEQISEKTEAIKFLRSADMGKLMKRPEFLVAHHGEELSLGAICRDLLDYGLAFQLVRSGFINRNFTLYTSTFHGDRVSTAATNFIIHHVEQDQMDVQFELSADDVDMVVRERGRESLREPALYNAAILDRIMESDMPAANIMIRSLAALGEDQKRFLHSYLSSGRFRILLVARLAPISRGLMNYLIDELEASDDERLDLVDAGLMNLAQEKGNLASKGVSDYLQKHYSELSVMTSEKTSASQAERVAQFFAKAGAAPSRLGLLAEVVQTAFVERHLYPFSLENLRVAAGDEQSLSLDSLGEVAPAVYDYCLDNLERYLLAIGDKYSTVDAAEYFVDVLEDILAEDSNADIEEIIAKADGDCVVDVLKDVSESVWVILAKHQRFLATFDNVRRYIDVVGSLDANLACLLSKDCQIFRFDGVSEEEKESLAKTILNATEVLPSAEMRSRLAQSLELENYLDVLDVPAETGNLFALLRKRQIIADNATSYERLAKTDWPTREAFIRESRRFEEFVVPSHVLSDLAALFLSKEVGKSIKFLILKCADEFTSGADTAGLTQLARFAAQNQRQVSEDIVCRLAHGGVPPQYVLVLLEPLLKSLERDKLFEILQALGSDYSQLTSVGRDRPKISNTTADRALLDRLKMEGIVNSYDPRASPIKVNKKHK
ncbi:DNA-binding protein [Leucobacter viscericola]|uniref:DNA-binding protein n=2 Tax=Leucobacter viscericola TaxID=2714935 RepID=A0A6G7XJT2_9MICO|nr:DNA-binding protein [Leucobacter viscericola]